MVYDYADGNYPYNCGELVAPQVVSSRADFIAALPLQTFDAMTVEFTLTKAVELRVAAGGDCDEVVVDGAGRTILDGDCTTADGATFSGFAVVQNGADESRNFELDEFSVSYTHEDSSFEFWADGDLTLWPDGHTEADLHYRWDGTGSEFPGTPGEFIRHQDTVQDGFTLTGKGYVSVIESEYYPVGELCFEPAMSTDNETCYMEPYGTTQMVGDAVVFVTMDGDVACDGCINMVIDGVDQGSVCP
jgi:hypothetical protein